MIDGSEPTGDLPGRGHDSDQTAPNRTDAAAPTQGEATGVEPVAASVEELLAENAQLRQQLAAYTAAWTARWTPAEWEIVNARLAVAEAELALQVAATQVRRFEQTIRLHALGVVTADETLSVRAADYLDIDPGDTFPNADFLITCADCLAGQDPQECAALDEAILKMADARNRRAAAAEATLVALEALHRLAPE